MKIYTYSNSSKKKATFYIQAKGLHAGRPLKNPIRNCFAVQTDEKHAFESVYVGWVSRQFEPYIGGSVIPFIKIGDVKNQVRSLIALKIPPVEISLITRIDSQIENSIKLIATLKIQKKIYSLHIIKKYAKSKN